MKLAFSLLLALCALPPVSFAETGQRRAPCVCKCVVKDEGKFSTYEASGVDREAAGEALKKRLGKQKCELTPICTGSCALD